MRKLYCLNDGWHFKLCDNKAEEPRGWYRGERDGETEGWRIVSVPHDWAVDYPFDEKNSSGTGYVRGGIGWFRLHYTLPDEIRENERLRLTFGGVYNNAQVWINSNYMGKHPYGYSEFSYDITDFLMSGALRNELVIAVRVPHTETADSRWYTGSGITRPVTLTVTDETAISEYGVVINTLSADASVAEISVKTNLTAIAKVKQTVFTPDNQIAAQSDGCDCTITVPLPSLWSPDSPVLYTLVTEVYKDNVLKDSISTLFGIRTAVFDADKGFLLNGKSVKFKGVCLHHDAGTLGAAVPKSVWRRRLLCLKQCGCNAVRTSHNPPDTALLDLCDEMGFLVMDEAFDEWEMPKNKWWHGHNVMPPKNYGYAEDFAAWGECDIKTMVRRDRNHPCIVMWSVGNEIDYPNDPYVYPKVDEATGNNDAGKPISERLFDVNRPDAKRLPVIAHRLYKWVKEVDNTRPVTMAMSFPEYSTDVGLNRELDISGYNYRENLYTEHHVRFPHDIIIGSENGHGADQWHAVSDNDFISGQFLWTGIDYLGEAHGWPVRCSGAGILDLAGFDKDRAFHRRAMWKDEPCAALFFKPAGSRRWHLSPFYRSEESEIDIICFTNAESADFYVNGKLAASGNQENRSYTIKTTLPYEQGELCVKCSNGATATLKTPDALESISLETFDCGITDDNIRQIILKLCDKNGTISPDDTDITVTVDGGELLGIENGRIDDLTGYFENHRSTYNGRLIIYIKKAGADKTTVTTASNSLTASIIV